MHPAFIGFLAVVMGVIATIREMPMGLPIIGTGILMVILSFAKVELIKEDKKEGDTNDMPILTLRANVEKLRKGKKKNMNNSQILQAETKRLTGFFSMAFKEDGLDYKEHLDISTYLNLTNNNEIVCDAKAKTERGAKALRELVKIMENDIAKK